MTPVRSYVCSVEGCVRGGYARGFCEMHYKRQLKHGDVGSAEPQWTRKGDACTVDGCSKPVASRQLCGLHYERLRAYGDPLREPPSVAERFWSKVDRRGPGECWPWLASRNAKGYGRLNVAGRAELASRVSWRLHFDEIPDGLLVCHHCDNPPCVNPTHLFLGTKADNSADMVRKGRAPRSDNERSARAKLTNAEVNQIRTAVAAGELQVDVAQRFGVDAAHVSRIVNGKRRPAAAYEAGWLRKRGAA